MQCGEYAVMWECGDANGPLLMVDIGREREGYIGRDHLLYSCSGAGEAWMYFSDFSLMQGLKHPYAREMIKEGYRKG